MGFKRYASANDFIKACSPYQVGDTVTLLRDICLKDGVVEKGTLLDVTAVKIRDGVGVPFCVYADEISNYEASEECFEYELRLGETKIGERFWFSNNFEKGLLDDKMIAEAYTRKREAETVIAKRQKKKVALLLYPATILITAVVIGLFLYIKNQGLTTGEKIVTGALMALVPLGAYACIWEKLDEWAWTEVHQFALKTRKEINEGM